MTGRMAVGPSGDEGQGVRWRTASPESTGLARYARTVRDHWWFVALAVVVALLFALIYLQRAESVYQAHAELLVQPSTSDSLNSLGLGLLQGTADPTRPLETVSRLVTTQSVADRARIRLKTSRSTDALLANISAQPVAGSSIVDVAAKDSTPQAAVALADAFASGIVDDRTARLHSELDALIAVQRVQAADPALLRELERMRQAPDPTVRLETPAPLPTSRLSPRPMITLIAALVAGLVIGIAGAFLIELFDPRVRREDKLRESYDVPVLLRVPRLRHVESGGTLAPELLDAYRPLRTTVTRQQSGRTAARKGSVLVTGATPSSGKTTTAAALAWSLASTGASVLIIETDVRGLRMSSLFDAPTTGPNLSDVLDGASSVQDAAVPVGDPDLSLLLLPAGRGQRPDQAPSDAAVQALLDDAAAVADWVIVDAPALQDAPGVLAFAVGVRDVVVTVRPGTAMRHVDALAQLLEQQLIVPAGFILTDARAGADRPRSPVTSTGARRRPAPQRARAAVPGDPQTPGG